ncbi:radical SAM family heme chaperone HemW [Alteromonas sp. 5E99-2]|uniref:radical SAM family heme chaperone HemW n=1 Tax=Alteromonas sp. 5E99-2 TaxID=2817683 RepID=UPI001A98A292|nr:radical SAM family heme chaperone HemW [Alteromonas sp. 5E99-2]MBO1254182.1 radical SAM family heme chaperone HemW [Alteromonas sp. 5E99-2]
MTDLPLSLYVHIPWCVQKCPYCDFNSHGQKQQALPEKEYVAHLLDDLSADLLTYSELSRREVTSIFIGGGTPSLFSAQAIASLLEGIKQRCNLAVQAEITLEANPGTVESGRFAAYANAGVTRFSIGIQSFNSAHLKALGRIHSGNEALFAISQAKQSGVTTFNTDLMHGLPNQSIDNALADLHKAIAQNPPHLSWYQLTIEPNTPFYSKPPELPADDVLWDIQQQGHAILAKAGYQQYEISGYSQVGHQCNHNLNYWRFGDYIGIGCGAHGKITNASNGTITRTVKVKHPRGYMSLDRAYLDQTTKVEEAERPFEFFMNRFRLVEACDTAEFERYCMMPIDSLTQTHLDKAIDKGLLTNSNQSWQVTPMGRRYLNSLLAEFV